MSYVKVSNSTSTKEYLLTNAFNKPYMHISGSILPLTTNTTNGLQIKIEANNTTYRPLEYGSATESGTYYTSAVNSNGLSSTTALTRSSTSGESYETRASTSGTTYTNSTSANWYASSIQTNYNTTSQNSYIIYTSITYYGQEFSFSKTRTGAQYNPGSGNIRLNERVYLELDNNMGNRTITVYYSMSTVNGTTRSSSNSYTNTYNTSSSSFHLGYTSSVYPDMPTPYPQTFSGAFLYTTTTQSWVSNSYKTLTFSNQSVYNLLSSTTTNVSTKERIGLTINETRFNNFSYKFTPTGALSTRSSSYWNTYISSASYTNGYTIVTTNSNSVSTLYRIATQYYTRSYYTTGSTNCNYSNPNTYYNTYSWTGTGSYENSGAYQIPVFNASTYSLQSVKSSKTYDAYSYLTSLLYTASKNDFAIFFTSSKTCDSKNSTRTTYGYQTYSSIETIIGTAITITSHWVKFTSNLTRSSTSKTVYLTRSSTSGYSGISSSSSESSGWK